MNEKVTLDTLEDDYWSLRTRVKGINNWIENNLATDPNFYEMVDCFMEFCKLTNGYNEYYTREGYPMLEENGQSRQTNSYDIFKLNPGLYDIRSELIDMYNLRKDSPFFQEELPNKVLEERKKNWRPKPVRYTSGTLRLFSELAASPMKGAYLEYDLSVRENRK